MEMRDLRSNAERPRRPSVLVIEADLRMRSLIRSLLCEDYEVERVRDAEQALNRMHEQCFDCVLLSIQSPTEDTHALLDKIRRVSPEPAVLVLCSAKDISAATEAIHSGAADFVLKDVEIRNLGARIARAIRESAGSEAETDPPAGLVVGKGTRMQEIMRIARRVASLPVPVLVLGETGTGKELFARWIHRISNRGQGPYVGVNLAAIPSDLIESTLFGHEKGAFTGAHNRRIGKFELAKHGTLLLDEVGELKYEHQAKLLRVLQENEYERVGGTETLRNSARIIAATNRNVFNAVRQGEFRDDLFYRLNTVTISLPPLRERREDIPNLVRLFLDKYNRLCDTSVQKVSEEGRQALMEHSWPGNIRELESVVQRAVILANGHTATPSDLFDLDTPFVGQLVQENAEQDGTLADLEQRYIQEVLRRTGGHQGRAVKILGVDRKTLYNKIMKYGLGRELDRKAAQA